MNKTVKIEKLKSFVIVALTISTVLLLYFFWADTEISKFSLADLSLTETAPVERVYDVEDFVQPSYFLLSFGDGEYSLIDNTTELFHDKADNVGFLDFIRIFADNADIFAEEITEAQYKEVFGYKSVKGVFDYYMPYKEVCDFFDLKGSVSVNASQISEIGFSEAAQNSVFLFDAGTGKYFRFTAAEEYDFVNKFFALAQTKGTLYYYYEAKDYFGTETDNFLLLPIYRESNAEDAYITAQYEGKKADHDREEAKRFFGNTFDFVRRIEEASGRVIYMYGYAEKVLILREDGSVEYKEENTAKTGQLGFFDAMDRALEYIERHGGFPQGGENAKPYISNVTFNAQGTNEYTFDFGMKKNGRPVFKDEKPMVSVSVNGDGTRYFYKNIQTFLERPSDSAVGQKEYTEVFSSVNTIAQNNEYIYQKILESNPRLVQEYAEKGVLETVVGEITSMKTGHRINKQRITPVWQVKTKGGLTLYFDLYTAEPLQ